MCVHNTVEYQVSVFDIVEVHYTCTIVVVSPDLNRLEMVVDWPNIDVAVMMRSYRRLLLGGRPVKTVV